MERVIFSGVQVVGKIPFSRLDFSKHFSRAAV
jgi:hypothetical protein